MLFSQKNFYLCAFLAVCFVQVQSQSQDVRCGDTLQISNTWESGSLSYKPNQNYHSNERCVWTLKVPGAWNATVELIQSGINGSDPNERVIVTAFRHGNDNIFQDTKFMRVAGDKLVMGKVDMFIVTFVSGAQPKGTGFVLNYTAVKDIGNPSNKSIDFISTTRSGSLSHPEYGNYDDAEFSTFIIAPIDFHLDKPTTFRTEWNLKDMGEGCEDVVLFYKFYPDIGWSPYDTYCLTTPKLASHNDLMLFVFKTNYGYTSTGFTLDWNLE